MKMACVVSRFMADFCLLLFLLALTPLSEALRFDVQSGQTKCISEDIKLNSMAVGKYSVINPSENQPLPDSHKLTVRVSSPYGSSIHYADHVDSGDFAFTSSEAGDYLACFWTLDHKPPNTITIEFDWRTGVAAKDWTYVAKKGQIDGGRNARNEHSNKFEDGLVELPFPCCMFIGCWIAAMASKNLF
ncbi:transmembrane emp24 domain-containing protein p24delta9 isoform X2 [Dendrobium catenatum]|uniref:transmembrane emp24 domain-containing protein p24delta9 isoform X2 n=1 Tax=Dendrobium catenatum TaxID=906689 RepID=UPI0010A08A7C|nr:transmembrane emp24 domain-containing protein p24delta9 isoform X2 [Dendrobium catenatum]